MPFSLSGDIMKKSVFTGSRPKRCAGILRRRFLFYSTLEASRMITLIEQRTSIMRTKDFWYEDCDCHLKTSDFWYEV